MVREDKRETDKLPHYQPTDERGSRGGERVKGREQGKKRGCGEISFVNGCLEKVGEQVGEP